MRLTLVEHGSKQRNGQGSLGLQRKRVEAVQQIDQMA
jgi:hypothetical protein